MLRKTIGSVLMAVALTTSAQSSPTRDVAPTRKETTALLTAGQFQVLDQRFTELQGRYRIGTIDDESMRAAFSAFYDTNAPLAKQYDGWLKAFPQSYVAYLARGIYFEQVGRAKRGGEVIGKTTAQQMADMSAAFARSKQDLNASLALDQKPILSYVRLLSISQFEGSADESRQLLSRATKIDPDNFLVREAYMYTLQTRWGGSVAQMQAFFDECAKTKLSAIHLRALKAQVVMDRAWVEENEEGNLAAAEVDYRKAVALGLDECQVCLYEALAGVLSQQHKYSEAIVFYSKAIKEQPDALALIAERAFTYRQMGKGREALADYLTAAQGGDAYSQNALGGMYIEGIPGILPSDPKTGIEWLHKAALQGYVPGQ
jgi:tetratricopeptide (TPR) repeat protein